MGKTLAFLVYLLFTATALKIGKGK